jgi:hypothetical protein
MKINHKVSNVSQSDPNATNAVLKNGQKCEKNMRMIDKFGPSSSGQRGGLKF